MPHELNGLALENPRLFYDLRFTASAQTLLEIARLLTAMLVGFGFLVWLPAPFRDPHKLINWAGNAQNLAITGAAWFVADFLGQTRPDSTLT